MTCVPTPEQQPALNENDQIVPDDLPEALIEAGPATAAGAVAGLAGTPFHDAIRQAKKELIAISG